MWHTIGMPSRLTLDTYRWNPERDRCPHCHQKPPDEVTSQWLEAPLDDGWRVALRVAVQDGWPVVAELRVFPNETDDDDIARPGCWSAERLGYLAPVAAGGLTARKLREVRLETLLREQFKPIAAQYTAILRRHSTEAGAPAENTRTQIAPANLESSGGPRRRRAASKSDLELARAAQEYLERCHDASTAQRPTAALADAHPGWTTQYARDQVYAARERGLLTTVGQGQQGGALTPMAEQLLHEDAASGEQHEDTQ